MDFRLPFLSPLRGGLRRHLVVLVLVPLIPMLLWAGGLTLWNSLRERAALERGLTEAARALTIAVDQEIRLTIAALDSAALARQLANHHVEEFAVMARRLAAIHTEWGAVLLFDAAGRVVFQSNAANVEALPDGVGQVVGRVMSGGDSAISRPVHSPVLGGEAVLVAVPVHDVVGRPAYVLAAAIRTERLAGLLWGQQVARGWYVDVTDAAGNLVTRVTGSDAPTTGLNATEQSALTGWTIRIGAPGKVADANLRDSLVITLGFGVLVLGGSVLLAQASARRILRPVQALTDMAEPFVRDRLPHGGMFGIRELDALYQALDVLSGELEKSQARFLEFFSAAPVMLFVMDDHERLVAVNDAWLRTLGYEVGEALGHTPWEFHTSASAAAARQVAREEFLGEGALDRFPAQYVTKAGEVREVLVSLRADRDADGRIVRTIGAVLDVTERRRAEAGLARAVEEAERANDAKTRFLAAASHDLRQPLQALSLYLGVLKARLQGREEQVMEAVGQCVESLTGLLNDMLDVARLDAGVISPKLADIPVSRLLERVAAAWRIQAEAKGLRLRVVPSSKVVRTDPALMDRVLSNLVANAVRYTARGSILVGCRPVGEDQVRIEVVDTGIGIPADKLDEIFEEFRQLGNPERRRDKGTGLGLAIVRRIADLLGHRVEVRSRSGRGSVFAVTLPMAGQCSLEEAAQESADNHARRILVVDDEELVRRALEMVLAEMGHQVETAETVEEALRVSRRRRPELVIADFRLAGGTTGIDAIRAVRANCGAALPAVVLTGDTDPATIRRIVDEGLDLLHKPLRIEALKGFLKRVA